MHKGITVLSLFDGISCGRIALERAGISVETYYASEIDKYAMTVSDKNYPDTIRVGDVTEWESWDIPWGEIDLVIGGSPCTNVSKVGDRSGFLFSSVEDYEGQKDNFDFGKNQSFLFWEYIRILRKVLGANANAKFLLENVHMKAEYQNIITANMGVKPLEINSNLLSGQNRRRLYWTNIEQGPLPENKNILIADILEDLGIPVIKSHGEYALRPEKAMCIDANYWKGPDNHGQRTIILECNELGKAALNGHDFLKRVYSIWGKAPTLTAVCGGNQERKIAMDGHKWRKLTPIECERLQTVPDNYTEGISNSRRYKCLGNGWTVDVIAHIFKGGKSE